MLRLAFLEEHGINARGCQRKHTQKRDRPRRKSICIENEILRIDGVCAHRVHLLAQQLLVSDPRKIHNDLQEKKKF